MSSSSEMQRVALTAAGAVIIALVVAHLRQPAEEAIKRGLVDGPERVGKQAKPESEATGSSLSEDEFTYDFIIIGGGITF